MAASKPFHTRGFVSMLMAFAFLGLAVSGVILYIAPPCSVADRIGWTVFALSKDQWASTHQVSALFILVLAIIHLFVFNWKTFMLYLRDRRSRKMAEREMEQNPERASRLRIPRELAAALIVAVVMYAGALTFMPPFGWLHDGSESFREHYRQEYPSGTGRGMGPGDRDRQGAQRVPGREVMPEQSETRDVARDVTEDVAQEITQEVAQREGRGLGTGRRDGSGQGYRRSAQSGTEIVTPERDE